MLLRNKFIILMWLIVVFLEKVICPVDFIYIELLAGII